MVFHCSLNNKSPQVSRTLLSILTDHNNAVVWMVSTRPLISESSSPNTNSLVTVSSAQLFHFQFYYRFLTILHRVFTSDLGWGKVVIICFIRIYVLFWLFFAFCCCCFVFFCLFWVTFFCPIDSTLQRRWAVPQSAIFLYFISLRLPGNTVMCLYVLFLVITRGGCPRSVMFKSLDCGIVLSEFELQSQYQIPFRTNILGKGINPLILQSMG